MSQVLVALWGHVCSLIPESGSLTNRQIVRETLESRRNSKATPGTDMLQLFLDKGVSEQQIGAEIVVTL